MQHTYPSILKNKKLAPIIGTSFTRAPTLILEIPYRYYPALMQRTIIRHPFNGGFPGKLKWNFSFPSRRGFSDMN